YGQRRPCPGAQVQLLFQVERLEVDSNSQVQLRFSETLCHLDRLPSPRRRTDYHHIDSTGVDLMTALREHLHQTVETECKPGGRHGRAAEFLDEFVVTSAAAHLPLGAEQGRIDLEYGAGIEIEVPYHAQD